MALGVCEIVEDDCHTDKGLEITVLSEKHLKTLIGKYFCDGFYPPQWEVLTGKEKELIGQRIVIRSPMTCQTKNFKVCKKCFGERRTRTNYVGITAAQSATERLTQLLMRSFHTSGSCELTIIPEVTKFIQNHLVNIEHDSSIRLVFNSKEIPKEFRSIPGFLGMNEYTAEFGEIHEDVHNNDTLVVVEKVKSLLRKDDKPDKTPAEYYQDLMSCILEVGETYSSYIELILAHIFMVDENDFWRYNQDRPIKMKLSDKTIAIKISPLLGFLYQPNRMSIRGVTDDHLLKEVPDDESLSFFEKIFLHKF